SSQMRPSCSSHSHQCSRRLRLSLRVRTGNCSARHWRCASHRSWTGHRRHCGEQRPARGVWAGLWTLPLFEDEAQLLSQAQRLSALAPEPLPRIEHALTHFDWVLHPRRLPLGTAAEPGEGVWVAREELGRYALPAPLKKLLG
ncbi:MAG TPA: NUDIX domain-containing protein, partial [Burkholderiaceae bacterium]|nr:NUDIX domain-containing protein [Burkholderiaceae bacterium]